MSFRGVAEVAIFYVPMEKLEEPHEKVGKNVVDSGMRGLNEDDIALGIDKTGLK